MIQCYCIRFVLVGLAASGVVCPGSIAIKIISIGSSKPCVALTVTDPDDDDSQRCQKQQRVRSRRNLLRIKGRKLPRHAPSTRAVQHARQRKYALSGL